MPKYKNKTKHGENSVYVFHNQVTGIDLFVNCDGADNVYNIFDSCGFSPRSHWKIMVEIGSQPMDTPKPKQTKPKKQSKFANRVEIY